LVESINEAQVERAAAKAKVECAPNPNHLSEAEVRVMIDSSGDVGAALEEAKPATPANLCTAIDLQVRCESAGIQVM
jgi:hypothetical protein